MSKTQVTKEVESKSQPAFGHQLTYKRCQRPKLLKKLKANHNCITKGNFIVVDVKDPSY